MQKINKNYEIIKELSKNQISVMNILLKIEDAGRFDIVENIRMYNKKYIDDAIQPQDIIAAYERKNKSIDELIKYFDKMQKEANFIRKNFY